MAMIIRMYRSYAMNPKETRQMQGLFINERLDLLAKRSNLIKPLPVKEDDKVSPILFELPTNQLNPGDIEKLNKEFKEIYGAKNHKEDIYPFPSGKEATNFFKQQAELGRTFLVKRANVDSIMYSDGKGDFFKGSQNEFDIYLQAAQETSESQISNMSQLNPRPESKLPCKQNEINNSIAFGC